MTTVDSEMFINMQETLQFKGSYTINDMRKQLSKVFSLNGYRRTYEKKSNVFQLNDPSNEAYLVEKGRVRTYKLTHDGKEATFAVTNPSESLGIAELLVNCPRMRYAETMSKTTLWVINKDQFFKLLLTHKEFGFALMWAMAHYLLSYQGSVEDLTFLPVRGRVIQLLVKLSKERGAQIGDCIIIDYSITHEEIAKMIGSCRQTVTSILNVLRVEGILKWEQKKLIILRWKDLNDML